MKRIITIILLAISFISCNAQEREVTELKQQLNAALTQVDSIKLKYDYKLGQYSDTILQMQNQIEGLKMMLSECPDTNMINELQHQKSALEIQIANMKIIEQNSYNLMIRFKDLWDEWAKLYPDTVK